MFDRVSIGVKSVVVAVVLPVSAGRNLCRMVVLMVVMVAGVVVC